LRSDYPVKSDQIPGLQLLRGDVPLTAFKTKIPLPELRGKSSGLRFVYEELEADGGRCAVGLTLYVHQQGDNEHEVRRRIADRSRAYESTIDSLWRNTMELLERVAEQRGLCAPSGMQQYSVDLRERRLGAIDAGLSHAEARRVFAVGTRTIPRWRHRRAEPPTLAPTARLGRAPKISPAQAKTLATQSAAAPDATVAAHWATWAQDQPVAVSRATMSRTIRRLGITLKKSPVRRGA